MYRIPEKRCTIVRRYNEVHSIEDLLIIVLTENHFQFEDENYLQVLGTAMGTKMAPSYAYLFKGKFENEFLSNCSKTPLMWLRFIDDIFFYLDS